MPANDLEKILNKRKPTAKDTLAILLNDIIKSRIAAQAKKNGEAPESAGLFYYRVIGQEDYNRVVLKLNELEYKQHQNNVRLYNFYYDMIEDLEAEHDKALTYFNCLLASFNYDMAELSGTLTGKYTSTLQWYIVEDVAAIKRFNAFVDAMKKETKDDRLEITKIDLDEIRAAYQNYSEAVQTAKGSRPDLYKRYTEINDAENRQALYVNDLQLAEIQNGTKKLKAFTTTNGADKLRAAIKKSSYIIWREQPTKADIAAELEQSRQETADLQGVKE